MARRILIASTASVAGGTGRRWQFRVLAAGSRGQHMLEPAVEDRVEKVWHVCRRVQQLAAETERRGEGGGGEEERKR